MTSVCESLPVPLAEENLRQRGVALLLEHLIFCVFNLFFFILRTLSVMEGHFKSFSVAEMFAVGVRKVSREPQILDPWFLLEVVVVFR